ncbi:hypothetical protein ACFXTI_014929 [Malus domestica]
MEGFSFLSLKVAFLLIFLVNFTVGHNHYRNTEGGDGVQPLSEILIHKTVNAIDQRASVRAYPHDWREGSEQYRFIEKCIATADRNKQPWLIFVAHRVLGYSANSWYGMEGQFSDSMGRDDMQKLWQTYKVGHCGHVHDYERICPIYQITCFLEYRDKFKKLR